MANFNNNWVQFKVGEKLVYRDPKRSNLIYTVTSVLNGDHLQFPVVFLDPIDAAGVSLLRHATDVEKEASVRLDSSKEAS